MNENAKKQLMLSIQQAAFAQYDTALFLDTHPKNARALAYFNKMKAQKKALCEEYERLYGPLTFDGNCNSWEWVNTPWPWEKED